MVDMIEATWVGGPNDGAVIALPDDGPIFLVSAPSLAEYQSNGEDEVVPVVRAKIDPVETELGWRLFYNQIEYADPDED